MASIKIVFGLVIIVLADIPGASSWFRLITANYEFQDAIKTEALVRHQQQPVRKTIIRETSFKKAQHLDIPITKEPIKVQQARDQGQRSREHRCPLHRARRSTCLSPRPAF